MKALLWAANLAGWPVIHLVVAGIFLRMPERWFAHDNVLFRARRWEGDGAFYRTWLAVRRWKSLLPDGAPWLGGLAKKRLERRDEEYVRQFIAETRRAECAHWCMLCCLPLFFLWNPLWARWLMAAYAVAANLPCIVVQRYNRQALERMMRLRSRQVPAPF